MLCFYRGCVGAWCQRVTGGGVGGRVLRVGTFNRRFEVYEGLGCLPLATCPSCVRAKLVIFYLGNDTHVGVRSGRRLLSRGRLTIFFPKRLVSYESVDSSFLALALDLSSAFCSSVLDKVHHFSPRFFICVEDRF